MSFLLCGLLVEKHWLTVEFWASVFHTCKKEAAASASHLASKCFAHSRTHFYEVFWVSLMGVSLTLVDSVMIAINVRGHFSFLWLTL